MRFEDTDKVRSNKEYEAVALEALKSLGLDFDHGPFRQSERTDTYIKAIETLIENGAAYVAEKSEGEDDGNVIRFKNPNKEITFTDIIRGEITIDTTDFGDFVIARSDKSPLYHLTVVVDDLEMGITHVIRGEDHITSTPRQMLLIEALGGILPTYAHLPLIVGEDKKKLGKRHGAVTYQEFRDLGYIPAGIINYLALLGWNPGDDREFFTKEELIEEFSLERVNNSPAKFSYEKLDSVNKHHILEMPEDEYENEVQKFLKANTEGDNLVASANFPQLVRLVIRERIHKFSDVTSMFAGGELDWFMHEPDLEADKLMWKDTSPENTRKHLEHAIHVFQEISHWSSEAAKEAMWEYAERNGKGEVLWPLRFTLTGQDKSPDPFTVAYLLGKEETLNRLNTAVELLE